MFITEFLSIFTIVVASVFFVIIIYEANRVIDEIEEEPSFSWKRPRA